MFVPILIIWLDALGLLHVIPSVPVPAMILCLAVFVLLCYTFAKRALRRASAYGHLLCPECTYDLRALDATGTCPECSRAYEHDAVRAQWLDAERRLKRK